MTTWKEFKQTIHSVPKEELNIVNALTFLQAERIRQNISQQELANRIGMKQPQLAKIERLDSIPTLTTLNRYAAGLNLEINMTITPKKTIA
jgi:transcriptional regulator with XRE-family HTH domain